MIEGPEPDPDRDGSRDGPALDARGATVADIPRELDPEWDEAFYWSYGPRHWNLGCG